MIDTQSLIKNMRVGQITKMDEKSQEKWRRIGKKRIREQTRREIDQWEDNMTSNKIKITRCESGD